MPRIRSTEEKLTRDPQQADAYSLEIQKLIQSCAIRKLNTEEIEGDGESAGLSYITW